MPVVPVRAHRQETWMAYSSYHKRAISSRELHPETQMMSYGYDPFLSEGAVKPPVFLTSTFAFRTAEDGAEFFDVVGGRQAAPARHGRGTCLQPLQPPEPGDRGGSSCAARPRGRRDRHVERHGSDRHRAADISAARRPGRTFDAALWRH